MQHIFNKQSPGIIQWQYLQWKFYNNSIHIDFQEATFIRHFIGDTWQQPAFQWKTRLQNGNHSERKLHKVGWLTFYNFLNQIYRCPCEYIVFLPIINPVSCLFANAHQTNISVPFPVFNLYIAEFLTFIYFYATAHCIWQNNVSLCDKNVPPIRVKELSHFMYNCITVTANSIY
jgi:hypothetical protein